MKELIKKHLNAIKKYNSKELCAFFGFNERTEYDILVVAPSYDPYSLNMNESGSVKNLTDNKYTFSYDLQNQDRRIAGINTSASAGCLIDYLILCSEMNFKKLLFIGSAGSLNKDYKLGEICTPLYSLSQDRADSFLLNKTIEAVPKYEKVFPANPEFVKRVIDSMKALEVPIKEATVFCTPSVALEYSHIEEILKFKTDLIEMETASFALLSAMIEKTSIALLVVSDNSLLGNPLLGRSEEEQADYDKGKLIYLPKVIDEISKMDC